MEIDGEVWKRRFGMGFISLIVLMVLLMLLGTKVGRAFLTFVIVVVSVIFVLGYTVDILHEAYVEYTK